MEGSIASTKANSRASPKDTPTVQFWLRARCALNAAESWWNGFQSLGLLYQLKRVPLDCGCKPKKSPIFFWTSWYLCGNHSVVLHAIDATPA